MPSPKGNGRGMGKLYWRQLRCQGVRTVAADAAMAIEQHFAREQMVRFHTITAPDGLPGGVISEEMTASR
jgi:hypothetical protein